MRARKYIILDADQVRRFDDFFFATRAKSEAEALRRLIDLGLMASNTAPAKEPRLLLPPPAPAKEPDPAPTLTELAALIRATAETNPFVRPLADLLEGRI